MASHVPQRSEQSRAKPIGQILKEAAAASEAIRRAGFTRTEGHPDARKHRPLESCDEPEEGPPVDARGDDSAEQEAMRKWDAENP